MSALMKSSVGLVVAVGLLLTGCAAPAPEPEAIPETSEPTPTPTVEPGFAPIVTEITGGILSTGPNAVAISGINGQVTVYSSASPSPIIVSHPVSGTDELTGTMASVQQVATAPQGFVLRVSVLTPSAGLEAEKVTCSLDVFDETGALQVSHVLDLCYNDIRLVDDVVVLTKPEPDIDDDVKTVVALDATTGETLWNALSGCPTNCESGLGGIRVGDFGVTDAGLVIFAGDQEMVGVDARSGERVWGGPMDRTYGGYLFDTGFDGVSQLSYNGNTLFDTSTGLELVPGYASGAVDPITGLITVSWLDYQYGLTVKGDGTASFSTVDPSDGSVVYSLGVEEGKALDGLIVKAAFDGRVWVWKGGSIDIVDSRTGAQDPAAPVIPDGFQHTRNVPSRMGATWVMMADTNGYGELGDPTVLIWSSDPLTFEDLPRTQVTGIG